MRIEKFDCIDSTNEYMKRKENKEEYDISIAKVQTLGKGKRGNVWVSNNGAALFSFLVKSNELIDSKLTIYAGYVTYIVINNIISNDLRDLKFKWPNDIYYKDKKICGILCEKINDMVIIGIGININNCDFGVYQDTATSLKYITGLDYNVDEIIIKIVNMFKENYDSIEISWSKIIDFINEKSYLKNKSIKINDGNVGLVTRIANNGSIEVEINNHKKSFSSLDFKIL